jgi:hypothetical protein
VPDVSGSNEFFGPAVSVFRPVRFSLFFKFNKKSGVFIVAEGGVQQVYSTKKPGFLIVNRRRRA